MKTELMERPKGVNISSMAEFTPHPADLKESYGLPGEGSLACLPAGIPPCFLYFHKENKEGGIIRTYHLASLALAK